MSPTDAYTELCFYTLAHPDPAFFIHQHVVDAYTAQTADEHTKPISIVFALVGLYLAVEKGYTGRQVQLAHLRLARNKESLPNVSLPAKRGDMTVVEVMAAKPGEERDLAIHRWCRSVWEACGDSQSIVAAYTQTMLAD